MREHLRANLWLLTFTVVLCAVLYPLTLLGIGQAVFPDKAQGSLIKDADGKVIGSRLIAQNFTSDETFWSRPSAASYNATASGASNWGANNPLLRNRVARQLGPLVRYGPEAEKFGKQPGALVGPDIEAWFQANTYKGQKGIVAQWFKLNGSIAEAWVKDAGDILTGKTAREFFEGFIRDNPGYWPILEDVKVDGETVKKIGRTCAGTEIQAAFFDMWRHDNDTLPLEPVPADMVMASASGLDPHITLDNARYQARYRVAAAWTKKLGMSQEQHKTIEARIFQLLDEHASAPLGGLAGVPLVNVLEVNLALRKTMGELAETLR